MPLMCTASGDGTARMWRLPDGCLPHQADEDIFHDALPLPGMEPEVPVVRDDLQIFRGHTGVVSSVELFGSGRAVTGSWDRSARVWDLESGSTVQVLNGHEADVTHVATHDSKPLILTSSRDASFRIWDTRHTANDLVFQGHADAVTSALFVDSGRIVSGSDDRTVKFWDMRYERLTTLSSPPPRSLTSCYYYYYYYYSLEDVGMVVLPHCRPPLTGRAQSTRQCPLPTYVDNCALYR